MKAKRAIFVGSLIVLFVVCYSFMNEHFDSLARYKYADDANRDLIVEYLNDDEINYLIDRQFKPEEFVPYFGIDGFNIRSTQWYNLANQTQSAELPKIVAFVNQYFGSVMNQDNFESLITHYSYETLSAFFDGDDEYTKEGTLIANPSDLMVKLAVDKTLYKYEPKDLVKVDTLPVVNRFVDDGDIYLNKETYDAMNALCEKAYVINNKTYGNMILVGGYVSYDTQEDLYDAAMLEYGKDAVLNHAYLPGHMEHQLGSVIELVIAKGESEESSDKQVDVSTHRKWLQEVITDYGFVFRTSSQPKTKEPHFILRYVGKENAKLMNEKGLTIEEME